MRDRRFKAIHRGGTLDRNRHYLLALWAADCAEGVLTLFEERRPDDTRPRRAIETARAWARGEATVGEARSASVGTHAAARAATDEAARFAARAAGQAVATAHMADHAPGAAWYAVKALRASGEEAEEAVEAERARQEERLSEEIRELAMSAVRRLPGWA
jgi:hypothetical protein